MSYLAVFIALGNDISSSYPDIAVAQILHGHSVCVGELLIYLRQVAEIYRELFCRTFGKSAHNAVECFLHVILAVFDSLRDSGVGVLYRDCRVVGYIKVAERDIDIGRGRELSGKLLRLFGEAVTLSLLGAYILKHPENVRKLAVGFALGSDKSSSYPPVLIAQILERNAVFFHETRVKSRKIDKIYRRLLCRALWQPPHYIVERILYSSLSGIKMLDEIGIIVLYLYQCSVHKVDIAQRHIDVRRGRELEI